MLSSESSATTAEAINLNKLLQIEAIKLIQISLDKLTSTKYCNFRENLYINLFIIKILKTTIRDTSQKLYYYQSIVNTMRCTLVSKLTFILNTNKSIKSLIDSTSPVQGINWLIEDDINLIIKEAIDNLVKNPIDDQNMKRIIEIDGNEKKKKKRVKLNDDDNDDDDDDKRFFNLKVEVAV